jgi:hypothetical protein
MSKITLAVFAVLAMIVVAEVPSLKFKGEKGSSCTVKKAGSDLQASCDGKDFKSILKADTSGLESRMGFVEQNINTIFNHLPCAPGEYRATANPFASSSDLHTAVCIDCKGNTFTDEFNLKKKCDACPTGYAHDDKHDHSYCDVCTPGYGANGGEFDAQHGFCTACPVNRFSGDNSQATCGNCPANTHTNGQHTQSACTMCAAGYERTGFGAAGHAICVKCVQGKSYSTASMITCDALPTCGAGQGAKSGYKFSTTQVPDATKYCYSCDANHVYSDEDSLSSCEAHDPCPAGQGVKNMGDVSDTSHRTCETCSGNKYSASNAFAQCYTKSYKYSKTSSATAPLQCASRFYRVGTIRYNAATGALSNDMCNSCTTCPYTPVKSVCGATTDARCCTWKPSYSSYTARSNTLSSTCAYKCTGSNTVSSTNCACRSGYERKGYTCTKIPVATGGSLVRSNGYCHGFSYQWWDYGVSYMSVRQRCARHVGKNNHFFVYQSGPYKYCYRCHSGSRRPSGYHSGSWCRGSCQINTYQA